MTDSMFESSLDAQIRAYANGGVRPFDAAAIADTLVGVRRSRWAPTFARPVFSPTPVLLVMGLLLALLAAVYIGARLLEEAPPPTRPLGQNGAIAYVVAGDDTAREGRLHVAMPDGSNGRDVGQASDVTFSADGSTLAFVRGFGLDADVVLADADGSNQRVVQGWTQTGFAVSPDGRTLVLRDPNDDRDFSRELWLATAEGDRELLLASPPGEEVTLDVVRGAWSPDGQWIAVPSTVTVDGDENSPYSYGLDIVNPMTGELRHLASRYGLWHAIAWAPDSKSIAFSAWSDGGQLPTPGTATNDVLSRPSDLYVVDIDGSGERQLTDFGTQCNQPAWSPKADAIACIYTIDGENRVGIVDIGAGDTAQPRIGPRADDFAWSPDGEMLLIASSRQVFEAESVTFDQGLLQTVDPLFASEPRTLVESEQGIRAVAWQWLPPDAAPPQLATADPSATEAPTDDPSALRMVVLGDSMVTYAAPGELTFPELYAGMIETATGRPVQIHTFGHESWHTSDALVAMHVLEPGYPSDLLPDADIVLIAVGARDGDPDRELSPGACTAPITSSDLAWECVASYAPDFSADLHEVIDELSVYNNEDPRAVRVVAPEFNRFVGWDQAPSPTYAQDVFVNIAFAMQTVACETAPSHGQLCTGIVELFNGPSGLDDPAPYLEPDRLNLNLVGRQRLAEAVFGSGLPEIDPALACIESSVQLCPTPYWRNR